MLTHCSRHWLTVVMLAVSCNVVAYDSCPWEMLAHVFMYTTLLLQSMWLLTRVASDICSGFVKLVLQIFNGSEESFKCCQHRCGQLLPLPHVYTDQRDAPRLCEVFPSCITPRLSSHRPLIIHTLTLTSLSFSFSLATISPFLFDLFAVPHRLMMLTATAAAPH